MSKILGVKCARCAEVIVSQHRHDWHLCKCSGTFVDGGRDYLRYGCYDGNDKVPEVVEIKDTSDKKVKK